MRFVRGVLGGLGAVTVAVLAMSAQDKPASLMAAHYTKYDDRIPVRDGVRLFTSVYVPKDASKPYPFLVTRTPYGVAPYGEDKFPARLGPSREFDEAGYIFVKQDVRGRGQSEGVWQEMTPHLDHPADGQTDESTDMFDTVEWLLRHVANHNGRVGLYGISYPGFYAAASIIDSHPAIKACSPQAPVIDLYQNDDCYHNGAFMLDANFDFYTFFRPQTRPGLTPNAGPFDYGTADAYDFYLRAGSLAALDDEYLKKASPYFTDTISHTTYDAFWQARDLSRHLHNIHCAVLNVGGLFDAEDISGPLKTFRAVERQAAPVPNFLVEGPWVHGGWSRWQGAGIGDVRFASNTAEFFRVHLQFPFFEHYLKGRGDPGLAKATVFETGTNVWRRYSSWPPANVHWRTLYFQRGGGLSFEKPAAQAQSSLAARELRRGEISSGASRGGNFDGAEFDEYVSDPAHPVPPVGYPYGGQVPQEYMVADQRFAAKRPDVLVYQTEPLPADVRVAGPVSPKLFVSTSGTDSDWVVKLIDVYPADYSGKSSGEEKPRTDVPGPSVELGGYEQLVRGEPMRGKFRHGFERPEAFIPGKMEEVDFSMPDVSHAFRAGHRIMVQVQSSWFPVADRNPQTFTDIPKARPGQFQKATERVYHSGAAPSGIVLGTLPSG